MARRKSDRKLEWDTVDNAQQARMQGWTLDKDDWWWRKRKRKSPPIVSATIGFTTPTKVYVRAAIYALCYDGIGGANANVR